MTWIFLALGGLYAFARIVEPLRPLLNLYGVPGSLFWLWLMVLAFAQLAYNSHLSIPWRLALLGILGAGLYVALVIARDWLSGWVPALAAMAVTLVMASPRLAVLLALGAGAAAAVAAPFFIALVTSNNEYSLMTRLEAWSVLWQIFQISPLIGIGPANYYWYTLLFPILGYYVSFNSHNNYVDIILQTGLFGLTCFLWFFAALWLVGRRMMARAPEGFARAYVYGALGGLAGTAMAGLLGDWVLPFVYNVGFAGMRSSLLSWLFLGGIVAIDRLLASEGNKQPERPSPQRSVEPHVGLAPSRGVEAGDAGVARYH
jgi:O-antigen ligase